MENTSNHKTALWPSTEFCLLVDLAIRERRALRADIANVFARAAEGLLRSALPQVAADVANIASRKQDGTVTARRVAESVAAPHAASIAVVWLLRGSRHRAVRALSGFYRHEPTFDETVRTLCVRALTPMAGSNIGATAIPPSIEVMSPPAR